MRPTVIPALQPNEFRQLDQRKNGITNVVLATAPQFQIAQIITIKCVKQYRKASRYFQRRRTPFGYLMFSDCSIVRFVPETWVDGRVLFNGRDVYMFDLGRFGVARECERMEL